MHGRNVGRVVAATFVLLCAAGASALELGEKAPELEVTAWAKGEPITLAAGAGKTVYVVEFFSVFKPECVAAMDAATKLQDKWKSKGLEVVAITVESKPDVDKFFEDHPSSCRAAIDENHNTQTAYFGTDPYLPRAVVVDKTGAVVFLGDPTDGMDKVVEDVIAGEFDLAKTLEIRKLKEEMRKNGADDDDEEEPPAENPDAPKDAKEAAKAEQKKRDERVMALCDKILVLDPADVHAWNRRVQFFRQKDDLDGYRKFVAASVEKLKDDAPSLSRIARAAMEEWKVAWRDPETALTAAKRAVEVSKSADADVVHGYADVLAAVGLLEMALEQEKKAAALEPKNDYYGKQVAFYQACIAVKQKAGKK